MEVEHGFLDLFLSRDPRFPEVHYKWLIERKYVKEDQRDHLETIRAQVTAQLAKYAASREIHQRFKGAELRMAGFLFVGKGDVEIARRP